MDGTREDIMAKIDEWCDDLDASSNILWISGFPGVGKSAIARKLATRLKSSHRFGSSFFFQRELAAVQTPVNLWRTIAFDLSREYPSVESMGSPRGLHFHFCHYSKSPCGLYAESMKTPHGVHMDFVKFMDSMKTCDQVSCGLLWTPSEVHGLSVDCHGLRQKSMDSPWTPSEIRGLRPHII
jgi:hypothetical protein